jgi:MarR family transcriptional regulator, organic hydroperoxide resistance regulator
METNKVQEQNSKKLVRHILKLGEDIFQGIKVSVPSEWLTSDMTVAQLRILLYLYTDGPSRMSIIASSIGIAVSTATGIVDNLVRKGLVTRSADPEDRRLVICSLSPQGRDTMSMMWTLGQLQMKKLLHGLSVEELEKVNEVAGILLRNVTSTKNPA